MASLGHESEPEHLLRIMDSIPSLIHTARPDGYFDYLNQRWLDYAGLPIEDLLGWKWTAAIHPEDVEGLVAKLRFSIASGEPFLHEARVRRADGEYRWMLHHKVAVRDEADKIVKWCGSSIDVEDRKWAECRIREQEAELRQMLDLTPQLVAVFGPGGERLYTNRIGLDYVGLSLEEWRQTGNIFRSGFIGPLRRPISFGT
jgi:PAS domain S-box-containing protein